MAKTKFPKRIFVTVDDSDPESVILLAARDAGGAVTDASVRPGESVPCAVYELAEVGSVTAAAEYEPKG